MPDVKVVKFLAPLFYANCNVLKDRIASELLHRSAMPAAFRWRALVLCFASVSSVDTTAMQALEEAAAECHAQKVPLLIASANALVEASFASAGFVEVLGGPAFMFRRVHEAVRAVLLHHLPQLPGERGGEGGGGRPRADSSGSVAADDRGGGDGGTAAAASWWRRVCAWLPARGGAAGGMAPHGTPAAAAAGAGDPSSPPAGAQPT